ncbi:cation diffusion facilitator family transporter [Solirhodobacter olei]|uniref:cation diffusion facilitator family transporter n=1 Tax=Solirhodobacter olei TaxID=2493082 RepID=UPI000FDCA28D|nr:cation diffusion facilitator family transporter [Solirhodobacter olei]
MSLSPGTRLNASAGLASSTMAGILVLLKLWALAQTGALSVAASLADSAMDFMISLGAFLAILYAARPPDEDHAFGHTSAEDLAALAQSVFVTVTGGVIGWAAAARLLSPAPVELRSEGAGMAVMALSILMTGALLVWQRRVVRRTGSRVVAADALHYAGDLVFNLGALISLWAAAALGLGQIDSVVGLGAAALLIFGALRVGRGAWDALMDRAADPEIEAGIAAIAATWPGVHGYHDIRTRTAGSRLFVQIHIELDGDQPLSEAHAIGASLRRAILEAYPQADVIIHKDVARG